MRSINFKLLIIIVSLLGGIMFSTAAAQLNAACCLSDGSCFNIDTVQDLLTCQNSGGTMIPPPSRCQGDNNVNGIDDICEGALGACCEEVTGDCYYSILDDCLLPYVWYGLGSSCYDCMPPELGACCMPDGDCYDDTTLDDCEMMMMGDWMGPGSQCTGWTEACCFLDGSCANADPMCCVNMGGVPQGPGTGCLGDQNANGTDDACEELDPNIKWSQPPVLYQPPDIFIGWDEPSLEPWDVMALDDFRCDTDLPITAIRWWGSLLGYYDDVIPPGLLPYAFYISIWTDTPASGSGEPEIKWVQYPDLSENGFDLDVTEEGEPWIWAGPEIAADDFPCEMTGPITDIHIWGSWVWDNLPEGDPTNVWFTVSIHANNPVGPYGYSEPIEPPLWQRDFYYPEFEASIYAQDIFEGYWIPCNGILEYDYTCWLYSFYIDPAEAFIQQEGEIYWLDIQAHVIANDYDPVRFGWKTSYEHYIDYAVYACGYKYDHDQWEELWDPYYEQRRDLAFMITTQAEGYSHPNELIWDTYCYDYDVDFYGWEYDPRSGYDDLPKFEFFQELPPAEYWYQPGDNGIYWLGIMALYEFVPVDYPWGWETRPHFFQDDAVCFYYDYFPIEPGTQYPAEYFEPIEWEGETWDLSFELISEEEPPPEVEYGDAPENGIANPSLGVNGAFPTCVTALPAGYIEHGLGRARFEFIPPPGPGWDPELDGDAGLCPPPGCFPTYDDDECYMDGDAGLIFPEPYTIIGPAGAEAVVPCPASIGTALGLTCQTAVWGIDIDIWVVNNMPADGYVNVLADWDQNGTWASSSPCPVGPAREHLLRNLVVPMGYSGQLSALMPAGSMFIIGPNSGYVWFRFSITERPVPVPPPGWNGDGVFDDGETEDYLLRVDPYIYVPKPPVEHLKWSQPPIEWYPQSEDPPLYCGWDEVSIRELYEPPEMWKVAADDFRCLGRMPITSIHWYGSYIEWLEEEPPTGPNEPIAWKIAFWSNHAADPTAEPDYSYPVELLWQIEVGADLVDVEWIGTDEIPDWMYPESCFQYTLALEPDEWFRQNNYIDKTEDNVFWISIAAIYEPYTPVPRYPWGWKTRPMHWMDDAVTFYYDGRLEPGVVLDPYSIYPLEGPCTQSFDLAFELDTDPCYIKHEQAYDSLRHWPWYHDEYSFAWETIYTETVTKWIQEPDFTNTGIDVDATLDQFGGYPPQLLADDFLCTETEWITDIHIYGSWWRDRLPMGGETQVVFTLSLHPDIPAGVVEPWSIPGPPLWLRPFGPGEFGVDMVFQTPESYYMPCTDIFTYQDHTMAWRYDFYLPKGELLQEGTPDEPVIYWLNVQAMPLNASDPDVRFGWKTSLDHWQDNAVFGIGNEPYDGPWLQIMNPLTEITDLAFEITTEKEYTELQIDRLVADDWPCETNTPVSAIVFWGSYLEYFYEACQCFEPVPTPVPPDYFLLQIWTDVPAGVDEPFSHPDEVIWEYKAYDYDEVMVGYDKYPEGGGGAPGYEPVFRYSVRLPEDEYFCQQEPNSVYWLSVVAVYSESEPMYPWGWTNHEHMYNDDAVEGFFDGIEWTWNELFDQNEPPQSQDMSFVLFTGRTCWDLIECAGQPFGDSTCDGSVNFADLAALKMGWMKNQGQPGYNCCTDFTQDGSINFQELLILKMYWMTSGYTPSTKNQTCCP